MSKKEEKSKEPTAEGMLAPQFGTDSVDLTRGRFDSRIYAKIGPLDVIWIGFFKMVPDMEGGEFCKEFCENYLKLTRSEDGWQQNKQIQVIAGSKGAMGVGELMKRPGLLQRNITQRDWKKKAEEEGKTIVE